MILFFFFRIGRKKNKEIRLKIIDNYIQSKIENDLKKCLNYSIMSSRIRNKIYDK